MILASAKCEDRKYGDTSLEKCGDSRPRLSSRAQLASLATGDAQHILTHQVQSARRQP